METRFGRSRARRVRSVRVELGWRNNGARTTPAFEHARDAWSRAIMQSDGTDLGFIGALAAHVVECGVCSRRWYGDERPVDILERRVRSSRVRDVWRAVG